MSVPITALISATATDATNVSFSAATGLRLGDRVPEAALALCRLPDDGGERDEDDQRQVRR
jgi:hypothetical protein